MHRTFDFPTTEIHNGILSVRLEPMRGMTVVSLEKDGDELLDYSKIRRDEWRTYGIPVLYPTPNKLPDDRFHFEGREYMGRMHGFLKDQTFEITSKTESSITGKLEVKEGTGAYEEFPFTHEIELTLSVRESTLNWKFTITNEDGKNMPFGLGIHPFFLRDENTAVKTDAEMELEKDDINSPTGRRLPCRWNDWVNVSEHEKGNLLYSESDVITSYLKTGKHLMKVQGDKHFRHCMIFTNPGEPFFCIEPQSAANNAINLFGTALEEISGVQVLKSGESVINEIEITVEK